MSSEGKQERSRGNRLLAALPTAAYDHLVPFLEPVSLTLKQVLFDSNGAIPSVYFPLNTVISQVIIMQGGQTVEVATVGNEGMIGLPVFLGAETIPVQAHTQIAGEALRMQADVFKDQARQAGPLREVLQRYTQALFLQVAQSSACNRLHSIDQRCARWLLMTQDRVRAEQFLLTQEFLAQMLGVRRASVSEVASRLQQAGVIQYRRGTITVLHRGRLEAISCECYAVIAQEHHRLFNEGGNAPGNVG